MSGQILHAAEEFHGFLSTPMAGSINFLNEVMARFPDAISFAPGAPTLAFMDDVDISGCIETYLAHLQSSQGLSYVQALQLLHEYGPSRGIINNLVSDALRRDGITEAGPKDIVITVGAQEAMFLTLRALFRDERDLLVIANPCYVGIVGAARLLNIDLSPVSEGDAGLDLNELEDRLSSAKSTGRRVRAIYVAPDHANPSGTVMDMAARRRLLDFAASERFFIIEDTAYGFTAPESEQFPSLKSLDRNGSVILVGTFAKIGVPGARVGFVVADQRVDGGGGTRPLSDLIATAKSMVTVNTSPISQAVIGGLLIKHGGSLKALGRPKAALYRRNMLQLLKGLDRHLGTADQGVIWNRPSGGFFVRVRLPVTVDSALLERSALDFGVLWTPMSQFHLDDGGDRQLRLSCSYLSESEIDEGVSRFAAFVQSLEG